MNDDELDRLMDKLTLRAKAGLLTGADTWSTAAEPAVELRPWVMSDGPAGVRGPSWDERHTAVLLPSATALAATWDESLVERLGSLLALEARRKGVHVVLAPNLNLHRSPLGGRHFECFSEDPELTGRIGAALVRGIQAHGVAATAKHFVANDSETERLTVDVRVGERALHEVYLAPFEAAVAAGVRLVMAGYNAVNGTTATASPLLDGVLREAWGFDGVVVSDWGAVRALRPTARAGLDLVMPGPEGVWGEALVRAVEAGEIALEAVDEKVRRLLRLSHWLGALGAPRARARAGLRPGRTRALLRRAAAAGTVLLANRGVLPLDADGLATVAVIGAHAARTRTQGGGSAGVFPHAEVGVLDGIRARLRGRAKVVHVPGPTPAGPPPALDDTWCTAPDSGAPGVLLRVLDAGGRELHTELRSCARQLEPPVPAGAHTVEISARLHPSETGLWTLGIAGFGRMSLRLDGRDVLAGDFARETDDPALVHVTPPLHTAAVRLAAGSTPVLVARRELAPGSGRAMIVSAAPPVPDPAAAVAAAGRAARRADVAVVVVGTTEYDECEGRDRESLALGPEQDALVREVAGANARTVVVVNSGGPVEMPWRDEVGALLLSWFPGQEGGTGLADVLFGRAEPGGRLPTTWPAVLADAPVTDTLPADGRLAYSEGIHVGHRGWLRSAGTPAYWFGHGLGYTTWSYEQLTGPDAVRAGDPFTVRVRLRNTGTRTGREVVQVYLARPGSPVEHPERWFAGHVAVCAGPGETVTARVEVPGRLLRHWDEEGGGWRVEPGPCRVLAGRSAGDAPLEHILEVRAVE
ncbi:glycoside hydrolase family 3 C-terminal domain-containing protein [Streptomyces sp. NBC_00083]|uniref:glycoside hydrolase family 3 C-terminal domain-containing protein n=1 Tax=Streptomyces sp. NBC_00083 TaxID=2975647 RepID=UPI00224EF655|nr:glycoside hydrolase family 3 C-terminal domain-containing protein [Streptomyces sp. NBC_00083]MCX5387213.1 glycoside hydrolase family 3 C-terminal domain-containing protein [Streptomyces sp. NBC_00083]